MEALRQQGLIRSRQLLLAPAGRVASARWCGEIESLLHPSGVVVYRARSSDEAVRRIESGGLSAAVLMEDLDDGGDAAVPAAFESNGLDVFSLLRIIRSIDEALPCWLVTRVTTRRTLERAFELRVQSMIEYPGGVDDLLAGLRKLLRDPALEN